jgi:hypothetical protein
MDVENRKEAEEPRDKSIAGSSGEEIAAWTRDARMCLGLNLALWARNVSNGNCSKKAERPLSSGLRLWRNCTVWPSRFSIPIPLTKPLLQSGQGLVSLRLQ